MNHRLWSVLILPLLISVAHGQEARLFPSPPTIDRSDPVQLAKAFLAFNKEAFDLRIRNAYPQSVARRIGATRELLSHTAGGEYRNRLSTRLAALQKLERQLLELKRYATNASFTCQPVELDLETCHDHLSDLQGRYADLEQYLLLQQGERAVAQKEAAKFLNKVNAAANQRLEALLKKMGFVVKVKGKSDPTALAGEFASAICDLTEGEQKSFRGECVSIKFKGRSFLEQRFRTIEFAVSYPDIEDGEIVTRKWTRRRALMRVGGKWYLHPVSNIDFREVSTLTARTDYGLNHLFMSEALTADYSSPEQMAETAARLHVLETDLSFTECPRRMDYLRHLAHILTFTRSHAFRHNQELIFEKLVADEGAQKLIQQLEAEATVEQMDEHAARIVVSVSFLDFESLVYMGIRAPKKHRISVDLINFDGVWKLSDLRP